MHRDYQTLLDEMAALEIKILDGEPTRADLAEYHRVVAEYTNHPISRRDAAAIEAWAAGAQEGDFHEYMRKVRSGDS